MLRHPAAKLELTDAAPVFTPAMPGNGDVIRYFKSCQDLIDDVGFFQPGE